MPEEALKKAVDMLLGGATMLREPCPYCGGVRVIKDGNALCTGCGREPDPMADVPEAPKQAQGTRKELEERLIKASGMLAQETDEAAKSAILDEIGAISGALAALGKK